MTFAPETLKELATYWKVQGGVNLGIVGDADHLTKGVSYHLGKDDLRTGAYSTERPRDRAGLTNAASAIDLGRLDGSYSALRAFSDDLARRCVKNEPGTEDVVEVIYSPDGKRVLGFKDGIDFLIPDYGDLSHLTHTHISFFRDSEFREKISLFRPWFDREVEVEFTIRGDVPAGSVRTNKQTTVVFVNGGREVGVPAGNVYRVYATIRRTDNGKDGYLIGVPAPGLINPGFVPVADANLEPGTPTGDTLHDVKLTKDGAVLWEGKV